MIKTLRELRMGTLCLLYVFGFLMLGCQYVFSSPLNTTNAQMPSMGGGGSGGGGGSSGGGSGSGSGSSEYTATTIGGETEGVSDETTCCNGVVLMFSSIQPASPWILDGEAIMIPGISDSYDNGNEYNEGENTLGTVLPGLCFLPDDYCESAEFIHEIGVIGTSDQNSNSGGGGAMPI